MGLGSHLPEARAVIFRYVSADVDEKVVEAWAKENGVDLIALERGPDGLVRGIARQQPKEDRPT
jgi:hypothetical protein